MPCGFRCRPALDPPRESDGGFKVERLTGWSRRPKAGGGGFRCVSMEPVKNPTGVLPGNPWQQLLLSHFPAFGRRFLLSSWRLSPLSPGKASSLSLARWRVSNSQEILDSAHSALMSVFTHIGPSVSCSRTRAWTWCPPLHVALTNGPGWSSGGHKRCLKLS